MIAGLWLQGTGFSMKVSGKSERRLRSKNLAVLTIGLAFGLGVPPAVAQQKGRAPMIEQEVMDMMKALDGMDERSRMKYLSQVDEQRNELRAALVKCLDTSASRNVQVAAIYLLGRHRFSEAVPELIKRIDFDAGETPKKMAEPLWERYPAMEALIAIGRPSIPAALELLATDGNGLRRDLAVKVIRYVEDAELARIVIERAQTVETDARRKVGLQEALSRLQRLGQATAR